METKIVKIDIKNAAEMQKAIDDAARVIIQGGLVVFPTETVYGLGGNGLSRDAAKKIYAAKGRPSDNPLILHIARPEDAEAVAVTSPMYERLATLFMPGPLTVVLPVKTCVPKSVTAGLSTVAVRCPAHPVAHWLIEAAGVPIAAPSANLSGSPSPTCGAHVIEDMNGRVDMILDGGDADFGLESTIVKIEDDESLTLLRPGAITLEDLRAVTPVVKVADAVLHALREGETVLSPGMKYRHYAPATETYLLDGDGDARLSYVAKRVSEGHTPCVLVYEEERATFLEILPQDHVIVFGKKDDMRMQAHNLFYLLREADKLSADEIYAPAPPLTGMGMALYNRMIRAAAHRVITL